MKSKLNVKRIIIYIIINFITVAVIFSPYIFINIKLIGNKTIELDYGEKYSEPGFKAYTFNREITDQVKVKDNIKGNIGNYEVIYSYKFLIYRIKKIRKVVVSDLSAPEIILKGDKDLSITINTTYEEPGYEATDNLDGDLVEKVKVTNNIDITKLGNYEVLYEVEDNAGNLSKEIRKVKVEKLKPTQMSIKDYTLDGWYDFVKLKETKNYGNDYFNHITIVGDSNIKNMYLNGYLKGVKAWALPCLHAESMHTAEINLYGYNTKAKLIDAVEKYKPEIMILNFGTFSTTWISEEVFIEKANDIIKQIKEKSPETKLILSSIYPVKKGDNLNNFQQEVINKYNFLILEMADKYNLKYLDVQEALKDDEGYANQKYYRSDKFHLTSLGHSVVKEYIKTHAIEED